MSRMKFMNTEIDNLTMNELADDVNGVGASVRGPHASA